MNTYLGILSISRMTPEMYFLNVINKKDLSKVFKTALKFRIY